MPLQIIRQDITRLKVDAIVNAANPDLRQGGGVCGAIFAAAGAQELQQACDRIGHCDTGKAVITPGFRLPAKYVIHTLGPVWQGGKCNERALLASCYRSALNLAKDRGLRSVAFPLISSGIYGYPKEEALAVATDTIGAFLLEEEMEVILAVFDRSAYQLSAERYEAVRSFIDQPYVLRQQQRFGRRGMENGPLQQTIAPSSCPESQPQTFAVPAPVKQNSYRPSLSEELSEREKKAVIGSDLFAFLSRKRKAESFSSKVMNYIDQKGLKDSTVYKRANLDRKHFSKIRSNHDYKPTKRTALALAIALELNMDQTVDLLALAGYALSPRDKVDLIVEYFILQQDYNIFRINEALFAFGQHQLGA